MPTSVLSDRRRSGPFVPLFSGAVGLAFAFAISLQAEVKLHPLFTDHAVLQQGLRVPVWGTADAGEQVTVVF